VRDTRGLLVLLVALAPFVASCAALPSLDPCTSLRVGGPCLDYDDIDAKKMFAKITDALMARDTKALKALFSQQALSDAPDFDAEADALLALFEGKIESQELNDGAHSGTVRVDDGPAPIRLS